MTVFSFYEGKAIANSIETYLVKHSPRSPYALFFYLRLVLYSLSRYGEKTY